mmetsp:Transcript_30143/g.85103  ORF Transcript_30143/g.85103 Transcript_30143/m.85103 type:complete len:282 (+) Transcript_30143:3012-3857(+)
MYSVTPYLLETARTCRLESSLYAGRSDSSLSAVKHTSPRRRKNKPLAVSSWASVTVGDTTDCFSSLGAADLFLPLVASMLEGDAFAVGAPKLNAPLADGAAGAPPVDSSMCFATASVAASELALLACRKADPHPDDAAGDPLAPSTSWAAGAALVAGTPKLKAPVSGKLLVPSFLAGVAWAAGAPKLNAPVAGNLLAPSLLPGAAWAAGAPKLKAPPPDGAAGAPVFFSSTYFATALVAASELALFACRKAEPHPEDAAGAPLAPSASWLAGTPKLKAPVA